MDPSSANSPAEPIETLLLLDDESVTRLRGIWQLLCVGMVDMPVAMRLVSDSPAADTVAFGPIPVVHHRPLIWPWKNLRMGALIDELAERPPEVIHAGSCGVYSAAFMLAEEFDADVVLHITAQRDIEALAHHRAPDDCRVIVGSTPLKQRLQASRWVDDNRMVVVRPGLLTDSQATCFQHPTRVPTLICYGSMESGYGMEFLIDALVKLQDRGLEVLAFLLGSGSREHQVHKSVVQHGLQSKVSFANPVGDPRALMHDADIFVIPGPEYALTETSVLAMTSGVAVVAAEGGVTDCYEHERTALVCASGSADALADALARLIQDRAMAQRLAAGALAHMKAHHGMSSMVDATFQVYQALAAGRRNIPMPNTPAM